MEYPGTYVVYYALVLGKSNHVDGLEYPPNPPKNYPSAAVWKDLCGGIKSRDITTDMIV